MIKMIKEWLCNFVPLIKKQECTNNVYLVVSIEKYDRRLRANIDNIVLWMMNCDGQEELIPVQGFGFFTPCALRKMETSFKVGSRLYNVSA